MVDPVNNSNVSGADYAKRTEGAGSVDNSDRTRQPNDQTVTTSHRPSAPEAEADPYLDDFEADESAIGRGLFGGEAMNPDEHSELIMTVRLTMHETVQELAKNDEDMRIQAENNMRTATDDRVESMHERGALSQVGAVTSSIFKGIGSTIGGVVGAKGGRDAIPVAQGWSGGFDALGGIDQSFFDRATTDKQADEAQDESDYSIDTSQTQHASSAFDSDMNTVRQIIRDGSDAMKEGEQAKRQEFNV